MEFENEGNHFDVAALPCYDLAGQIQANAHALLFVYFFLFVQQLKYPFRCGDVMEQYSIPVTLLPQQRKIL